MLVTTPNHIKDGAYVLHNGTAKKIERTSFLGTGVPNSAYLEVKLEDGSTFSGATLQALKPIQHGEVPDWISACSTVALTDEAYNRCVIQDTPVRKVDTYFHLATTPEQAESPTLDTLQVVVDGITKPYLGEDGKPNFREATSMEKASVRSGRTR